MNYDEVYEKFNKIIEKKMDCNIKFWVGLDGIYHDSDYPKENDNLICYCGISYSMDTCDWIVTPWLYTEDCAAVFKKSSNARQMFYFWLNWMTYLYGDGNVEPKFEENWLSIKSNRSIIMMLFVQEGEKLKKKLWKEEGKDVSEYEYIIGSDIKLISPD